MAEESRTFFAALIRLPVRSAFLQEGAVIQRFLNLRLLHGHIPDRQNRKAAKGRDKRKKDKREEKFR